MISAPNTSGPNTSVPNAADTITSEPQAPSVIQGRGNKSSPQGTAPQPPKPIKPNLLWVYQRSYRLAAFGLGTGLMRPAPGTWGSLAALILWFPLSYIVANEWIMAALLFFGFSYGVYCCQRVGRELGVADHSGMVWDEWIGLWLVLFVISPWVAQTSQSQELLALFGMPYEVAHEVPSSHGAIDPSHFFTANNLPPLMALYWYLIAFGLFRFFDIIKPWPIRFFDERLQHGLGVMVDDLIAALYTLFVFAVIIRLMGLFW